jgi:4-hydroxybenzoate polyprenyltransferase
LSLLGIVYSVPLVPLSFRRRAGFFKLKDIPGSRALSEALAWVAIICILPLLVVDQITWPAVFITIVVVFTMAYAKAVLFDIFQVQGDLIAGAETLPITLGERKTSLLLKVILGSSALVLLAAPILGLVSSFSYLILITILTLFLSLWAYERRWLLPGVTLEAVVEGNLLLSGLLALLWNFSP